MFQIIVIFVSVILILLDLDHGSNLYASDTYNQRNLNISG